MKAFAFLFFSFVFISSFWGQENDSLVIVSEIIIEGNKKTKPEIIHRQLTFQRGDTISNTLFEQEIAFSEKNLFNTQLFNFVEINSFATKGNGIIVQIRLVERWYTFPIPVFEIADPNFNVWWKTRDFSRTNYGIYFSQYNCRGRNETLVLKARLGYTRLFELDYKIPFLNKAQTLGMELSSGYFQNNEVTIGTIENKREFFRLTNGNSREEYQSKLTFVRQKKIYTTHRLETKFTSVSVADSLALAHSDYLSGGVSQMNYFSLKYTFKHDKRDIRYYPLNGWFFKTTWTKNGLGIANKNALDLTYIDTEIKKFWHLKKRWYYAAGLFSKISFNKNFPYYIQQGLGYQNYVRGNELHIIDGQQYGLLKTNLKYELIKKRNVQFNVSGKENFDKLFYSVFLNFNADAGYVEDKIYTSTNPLGNRMLFGYGIGLDFVSFYDIVIRCEYSFNDRGENGFFLHFVQPI